MSKIIITALLTWFAAAIMLGQNSTYTIAANTDPTVKTNWNKTAGAGPVQPTFTATANTYNFVAAGSHTMGSTPWKLGSAAILNIGQGGAAVTFNTNGKVITHAGATSPTMNVLANGVVNVTTSNFFAANNLVVGTCSAGSLVNYNFSGATVGGGTYDKLTLTQSGNLNTNYVTVNNILTLNAIFYLGGGGGSLTLAGTFAGASGISGDATAAFNYTGAAGTTLPMDMSSPGNTNIMGSVQNNGTGTLVLGNDIFIAPLGELTPVSGDIDASGVTVTLLADQSSVGNTGSIGAVGANYIGNLTVQAFHNPAGHITDWTTVGSPGITNADFTQWNNSFPITCLNCPNGYYPDGVTPFGSITGYVEATGTYPEISNTTDPMTVGKGWWVYMGNTSGGASTNGELLVVSGAPNFGPFPYNVTAGGAGNGYNLLSNPFPSPISWTSVYNNNAGILMSSSYATWSPNLGDHAYFDAVSGSSNPSSGSYVTGDIIPISMGFFVQASGNGQINFDETDKSQGTQAILRYANQQTQRVMLPKIGIQAAGQGMMSEALVVFTASTTAGFDNVVDTKRIGGNAGWLSLNSVAAGNDLAINGMPPLTANYSIPIKMQTATTGTYAISAANLNTMPAGACLMLHDNYTGTDYDMKQGPYTITLNDTESVARFVLNVTIDNSLTLTTSAVQATCPAGGDAKLIAAGNDAGPWNYTWKDASNVIVRTVMNKATADTLGTLSAGVYSVDVNTVGTCKNATQSYTLALPAGVSSAFTVNSNSVLVNNPLNFTDNSTLADAWYWDFGDTTNSTMQSPVHTYTNTGAYEVTLYAINTPCGDTAASQVTFIEVLGATAINQGYTDGVYVSKDAAGAFVKFNYHNETKVGITVYNALGQVLYNNASARVSKDKIYLDLERAKEQVVFVSIVNFDSNTQVTKKLFND